MTELNAKIIRVGSSYGILIPKALVDCKVLDRERTVKVVLSQKGKSEDGERQTQLFRNFYGGNDDFRKSFPLSENSYILAVDTPDNQGIPI